MLASSIVPSEWIDRPSRFRLFSVNSCSFRNYLIHDKLAKKQMFKVLYLKRNDTNSVEYTSIFGCCEVKLAEIGEIRT